MIWTIAKREFLDYLVSFRFLVGLAMTFSILLITTGINLKDYDVRLMEFNESTAKVQLSSFEQKVYYPPGPMSPLAEGFDRSRGALAEMYEGNIPTRTTGYFGGWISQARRMVSGFATIDFDFVVRVVMSLFAIFLAFDSVAGEKSAGTLRLVLANPVPKIALIAGKLAGGMGVVLVALLADAMSVAILIAVHHGLAYGLDEWLRFAGIIAVSLLYVCMWFSVGFTFSVLVNRPAIVLAVLLQVWVVVVLLIPSFSVGAASWWVAVPSMRSIESQEHAIADRMSKEQAEMQDSAKDQSWSRTVVRDHESCLARKFAEERFAVKSGYDMVLKQQKCVNDLVASGSPASLYDRIVVRLAGSGNNERERFQDAVVHYWREFFSAQHEAWKQGADGAKMLVPFQFHREPLGESVQGTLTDLCLLFGLNGLLIAISHVAFLRKDVR